MEVAALKSRPPSCNHRPPPAIGHAESLPRWPERSILDAAFFSTRAKAGTLLDGLLYDAGVVLSLALQYGTPATALAKSVARLEDGSPASPVGELIDVIVKEVEASNKSNSQGAADADVQAEEDQAKEGAWELFTG